jgi:hypothetical protein
VNPALGDRVKESSTTTGLVDLALAGAPPGFVTWALGIGAVPAYYAIVHRTVPEWEVGIGTATAGVLARTTVLKSSNGNAKVNFSAGTKDVFSAIPAAAFEAATIGTGAGRLVFENATQVAFRPYNGRLLPVKDAAGWRNRDIGAGIVSGNPSAAVNRVDGAANQALAAGTTYLVTVFDNAGVLTFDFLTTLAHAVDATTGVEIKSGDDSRTVVGMVRTTTPVGFADSATKRLVLSWANRRPRALVNSFTVDRTTTSTTYVEINSEIRLELLTWGDESVALSVAGSITNSGVAGVRAGVALDSTTVPESGFESAGVVSNAGAGIPLGIAGWKTGAAEGYHFVTLLGLTNVGTATFPGVNDATYKCKIGLQAAVRG